MTIQEFKINKIIERSSNRIRTNYNSDLNYKLFLDPNLFPLIPKDDKLVGFSQDSFVLEEVAEQYKKFTDLITRKIFQNKVNFEFYNFTKKPDFFNNNLLEAYRNNRNAYYGLLVGYINGRNIKIRNVTDFYNTFLDYIEKYSSILPLTLYNLNFRKRLYFENTGLSIVLKQKGVGSLTGIFEDFLRPSRRGSTNDYVKIANLQGFEVDLANPYRLVYNPYRKINNVDIKRFYSDNFFNYFSLEFSYLDTMVTTMYNQYNEDRFPPTDHFSEKYKVHFPNEMCKNQIKTIKENVNKEGTLTKEQKLKLYFFALLSETGQNSMPNKDMILHNAMAVADSLDMPAAMQYTVAQVRRSAKTTTFTPVF
jgi:hypothetical protein